MLICFNRDFCLILEFHLTGALTNYGDNKFDRWWCDGIIIPPDIQLKKNIVIQSRKIITAAHIGISPRSTLYEMVIHLGDKAKKLCQKNRSLKAALPDETSADWIKLDQGQRIIELQLL